MKAKMKTLMAAIALGSTLGYAASANANIIDLFSEPAVGAQAVSDDDNAVGNAVNTVGGLTAKQYGIGANILGGYRDLIIDAQAGAITDLTKRASMAVTGGVMSWSNDDGVQSVGKIQWDGDDSGSVANLNIGGLNHHDIVNQVGCNGACNTLIALVNHADLGFNYDIGIYTSATQYTILKSGTLFGINSPYASTYSYDWFGFATGSYFEDGLPFDIVSVGGGANLMDVGAIEFTVYNTGICYQSGNACEVSVDLNIDSITKIPEPASLALVGLGLVGLAGLRRRKQNA